MKYLYSLLEDDDLDGVVTINQSTLSKYIVYLPFDEFISKLPFIISVVKRDYLENIAKTELESNNKHFLLHSFKNKVIKNNLEMELFLHKFIELIITDIENTYVSKFSHLPKMFDFKKSDKLFVKQSFISLIQSNQFNTNNLIFGDENFFEDIDGCFQIKIEANNVMNLTEPIIGGEVNDKNIKNIENNNFLDGWKFTELLIFFKFCQLINKRSLFAFLSELSSSLLVKKIIFDIQSNIFFNPQTNFYKSIVDGYKNTAFLRILYIINHLLKISIKSTIFENFLENEKKLQIEDDGYGHGYLTKNVFFILSMHVDILWLLEKKHKLNYLTDIESSLKYDSPSKSTCLESPDIFNFNFHQRPSNIKSHMYGSKINYTPILIHKDDGKQNKKYLWNNLQLIPLSNSNQNNWFYVLQEKTRLPHPKPLPLIIPILVKRSVVSVVVNKNTTTTKKMVQNNPDYQAVEEKLNIKKRKFINTDNREENTVLHYPHSKKFKTHQTLTLGVYFANKIEEYSEKNLHQFSSPRNKNMVGKVFNGDDDECYYKINGKFRKINFNENMENQCLSEDKKFTLKYYQNGSEDNILFCNLTIENLMFLNNSKVYVTEPRTNSKEKQSLVGFFFNIGNNPILDNFKNKEEEVINIYMKCFFLISISNQDYKTNYVIGSEMLTNNSYTKFISENKEEYYSLMGKIDVIKNICFNIYNYGKIQMKTNNFDALNHTNHLFYDSRFSIKMHNIRINNVKKYFEEITPETIKMYQEQQDNDKIEKEEKEEKEEIGEYLNNIFINSRFGLKKEAISTSSLNIINKYNEKPIMGIYKIFLGIVRCIFIKWLLKNNFKLITIKDTVKIWKSSIKKPRFTFCQFSPFPPSTKKHATMTRNNVFIIEKFKTNNSNEKTTNDTINEPREQIAEIDLIVISLIYDNKLNLFLPIINNIQCKRSTSNEMDFFEKTRREYKQKYLNWKVFTFICALDNFSSISVESNEKNKDYFKYNRYPSNKFSDLLKNNHILRKKLNFSRYENIYYNILMSMEFDYLDYSSSPPLSSFSNDEDDKINGKYNVLEIVYEKWKLLESFQRKDLSSDKTKLIVSFFDIIIRDRNWGGMAMDWPDINFEFTSVFHFQSASSNDILDFMIAILDKIEDNIVLTRLFLTTILINFFSIYLLTRIIEISIPEQELYEQSTDRGCNFDIIFKGMSIDIKNQINKKLFHFIRENEKFLKCIFLESSTDEEYNSIEDYVFELSEVIEFVASSKNNNPLFVIEEKNNELSTNILTFKNWDKIKILNIF